IHGAIQGVTVDGCRAGVHPQPRSVAERSHDFIQKARASNPRIIDGAPVGCRVPAIDAPAGQINTYVALLQIGNPAAGREAIPENHAPGSGPRTAAEYG